MIKLARETVVGDRYRLTHPLGEGGMGMVWAATHLVTRKPIALKFLKATGPDLTRRFLREARVAGAINHPNIIPIHDVIELADGSPAMVMDLLRGESLATRLRRVGSLPLPDIAAIVVPVVSAVGTAHAHGVVHRDLKPDNIFLVEDGDVKVLDFGIAKLTASDGDAASTGGLTTTGSVLGTPYYMAPEQVFGEKDVDHRADIWALGVVLYEALSGQRPIEGENVGQIFKAIALDRVRPLDRLVVGLPSDIVALVTKMLSRERDARPSDLREVFSVLAPYSDHGAQSFGAAAAPRSWSPVSDRRHVSTSSATDETVSDATLRVPMDATPHQTGSPAVLPTGARTRAASGVAAIVLAGAAALGLSTWAFVSARAPKPAALDEAALGGATPRGPTEPSTAAAPTSAPPSVTETAMEPPVTTSVSTTKPPTAPRSAFGRGSAKPSATGSPESKTASPSASASGTLPGGIHGESPY